MLNHTPGPWQVCSGQRQEVGFNAPDRWRTIATAPSSGLGIASDPLAMAEARANARLIAEAPAMLATLRLLFAEVMASEECFGRIAPKTLEFARDILARIEGIQS